jgi:hypothetical protein
MGAIIDIIVIKRLVLKIDLEVVIRFMLDFL